MQRLPRWTGALATLPLGLAACAAPLASGIPVADPAAVAARARDRSDVSRPVRLRFDWKYGDRRGDVRGEGVGRFSPPDSLRVDLFTSGDVAMAVALAGDRLTSLGRIEDVELPPRSFLLAMAGLFRPGGRTPERGLVLGEDSVLVYRVGTDRSEVFYLRNGRLRRLEEREGARVIRRVEVEWGVTGPWPREAEYRDLVERNRVHWTLRQVDPVGEPYPAEIYELPNPA